MGESELHAVQAEFLRKAMVKIHSKGELSQGEQDTVDMWMAKCMFDPQDYLYGFNLACAEIERLRLSNDNLREDATERGQEIRQLRADLKRATRTQVAL